jgi:hypothetical protein
MTKDKLFSTLILKKEVLQPKKIKLIMTTILVTKELQEQKLTI